MKVGLYFGTFNPIHVGHMIIANYMADYTDLDEVWLLVTPQNPLKSKNTLLKDSHRLALVREAVYDNIKLKASDIEFGMSKPNYTSHTLVHLMERYPEHEFSLIMGEDNLRTFHKWFNHEVILKKHNIYVYPRVLTPQEKLGQDRHDIDRVESLKTEKRIVFCNEAPVMRVSSSFIRQAIKNKKDVRYLLTETVFKYVDEMNFYK